MTSIRYTVSGLHVDRHAWRVCCIPDCIVNARCVDPRVVVCFGVLRVVVHDNIVRERWMHRSARLDVVLDGKADGRVDGKKEGRADGKADQREIGS